MDLDRELRVSVVVRLIVDMMTCVKSRLQVLEKVNE